MASGHRLRRRAHFSVACLPLLALSLSAQGTRPAATTIDRWLVLGPLAAHGAAFAAMSDSTLLSASRVSLDHGWPAAGMKVEWLGNQPAQWSARDAAGGTLQLPASPDFAISYAAAYLDADR